MLKILPAVVALVGLAACAATPPAPIAGQPCWTGPAPSCLPPVAGEPPAAAATAAAGPYSNDSHAYVDNPK
jgi:hypothetical protein